MAKNKDAVLIAQSLIKFIEGKTKAIDNTYPSIYKVPDNLRNLSPCSFTPQVVSIGPLHRKDVNLQRFENRKAAFVHGLLCRLSSAEQAFKDCMEKVIPNIKKIKKCYAEIEFDDDIELAKVMVMDACFIIEFIDQMSKESDKRWQDQRIPYDLVLLENQIPFFVLKDIHNCLVTFNYKEDGLLTSFIHPLLKLIDLFQGSIKLDDRRLHSNHDHILACLYNCYQPEITISSSFPRSTIHSATELEKAGVNFKPNKDAEWPMAMNVEKSAYRSPAFGFKATLTMPILRIHVFTELVLRNLIAYEQSNAVNPYVTSYARAMDMLIDTPEDVAKLVASKVMVNHIGSNEEAASMINGICKQVAPEHFYYTQQWEELDEHFNDYWPRKIVKLKRTYFHSPWSIIALFAGMVLFVLAMLQTIFTIKPS